MSNKHETIADIVATMRNESHAGDESCLEWVAEKMRSYADRIEAAATQPVTNCNHLGNAAKIREAVRGLLEIVCIDCKSSYEIDGKCVKCPRVVAAEAALSAPPRNCDRFSNANEALEAFEKETGETMIEFIRWLFAEERGGAEWMV